MTTILKIHNRLFNNNNKKNNKVANDDSSIVKKKEDEQQTKTTNADLMTTTVADTIKEEEPSKPEAEADEAPVSETQTESEEQPPKDDTTSTNAEDAKVEESTKPAVINKLKSYTYWPSQRREVALKEEEAAANEDAEPSTLEPSDAEQETSEEPAIETDVSEPEKEGEKEATKEEDKEQQTKQEELTNCLLERGYSPEQVSQAVAALCPSPETEANQEKNNGDDEEEAAEEESANDKGTDKKKRMRPAKTLRKVHNHFFPKKSSSDDKEVVDEEKTAVETPKETSPTEDASASSPAEGEQGQQTESQESNVSEPTEDASAVNAENSTAEELEADPEPAAKAESKKFAYWPSQRKELAAAASKAKLPEEADEANVAAPPKTDAGTCTTRKSVQTQKLQNDDDTIRKMLTETKTIALVGASTEPGHLSNFMMDFMLKRGYQVIPVIEQPIPVLQGVSTGTTKIMGRQVVASLKDIKDDTPIDMVYVFHRSAQEDTTPVIEKAIAINAKSVWLQAGVINDKAGEMVQKAGLDFVQNVCPRAEMRRLGIKVEPMQVEV